MYRGGPLRTNAGVSNLAKAYGGLNINVTRVVFTVGTIDPWSSSGLTKNPNPESPVLIIKGNHHVIIIYYLKFSSQYLFEMFCNFFHSVDHYFIFTLLMNT